MKRVKVMFVLTSNQCDKSEDFWTRTRVDYIEYVANKDYWDGPPKLDKLIVKVIPDNEVRLLSLNLL